MTSRALSLVLAASFASGCVDPSASAEPVSAEAPLVGTVHALAAMAPLTIGDLEDPRDPAREGEWTTFARELAEAKALGIGSISVDVWWGSVERAGDVGFRCCAP